MATARKATKAQVIEVEAPASSPEAQPLDAALAQAMATIAQLQRQIEARDATVAPTAPAAPAADEAARVKSLERALIATQRQASQARRMASEANDAEVYEVTNLHPVAVTLEVQDGRGDRKYVHFEKKGDARFLTAAQIETIRNSTRLFDDGLLYSPDWAEPGPNVIPDFEAMLNALSPADVRSRITSITAPDVLSGLYQFLESRRYETENGSLVTKELPAVWQMALMTVAERMESVTGCAVVTGETE